MTLIVETDVSQLQLLQDALPGSVALTSISQVDEHVHVSPREAALVIGPSVPMPEAMAFAEGARIERPYLGVILLRQRVESQVLTDALRSGMREVVDARDLTGLAQAVQRAQLVGEAILQTQEGGVAQPRRRGSLVTVFSTKGGVGKSLVATNLAAALADLGKRVCLVDLDVHSGDVAIMLQLTPAHQLNDLVAFAGVIDEGAVTSLLTEHSTGLSVVAAPIKIDGPDQASTEDVAQLLERLKEMFEVVVVDTTGIFDDHALVSLDRSDTVVLVGTLDIPALKSLKLAIGTLDLLNFPREKWRLVLNRADAKVGLSVKEFEETLGLEADCRLASSREVLAAVNRGEPIVRAHPSHSNSKALVEFAQSFVQSAAPVRVPEQDNGSSRRTASTRRLRLRKASS